jgi:catechol 2,3-dioxygenase-like lactoylglutathione lyase family enzyme
MIDHIGLAVGDFAKSKAWYAAALAPIGYTVIMEFSAEQAGGQPVAGLGDRRPDLWISGGGRTAPHTHIALQVKSRALVDAFYKAALAAGGRDNGPPGIRAHYHPDYYGAFVLDPDGHNVEVVCHFSPSGSARRAASKAKAARAAGANSAKKKKRKTSTRRAGAKRKKR